MVLLWLQVLSIVDSTYHIPSVPHFGEKKKVVQKQEKFLDYKEKFSVFISYIGISLINSGPEVCIYIFELSFQNFVSYFYVRQSFILFLCRKWCMPVLKT